MGLIKYNSQPLSVYDFKNNILRDFYRTFVESEGFDHEAINALCADTNEITVIKMLAHYDQNLKMAIAQVALGLREGRNDLVEKAAHKLIGTSELLGFRAFAIHSRELTQMIRNHEPQEKISATGQRYLNRCAELFKTLDSNCPSLKIHL